MFDELVNVGLSLADQLNALITGYATGALVILALAVVGLVREWRR